MANPFYRPDIDGMRAVAVALVIAHHFGIGPFPGGYVGVDVFFVISGFLITSLILADGRRFSLLHFYERRMRRILPALLVVIVATLATATVLFIPRDLSAVAESSTAALLFVSNFYFQAQSGYFDAAAELKPLLHTWSLGIEEQFYILHPLWLMLLARFGGWRSIVAGTAIVMFMSLSVSVLTTATDPTAAYYLLPARAWELSVGALLATGALAPPRKPFIATLAAGSGLALIVFAAVSFSAQTSFPGYAALAPVIGTALLLWAGQGASAMTRLLSWRPLVGVGLISYSLYLWHWPILVFGTYAAGRALDGVQTVAALALVAGLSLVTYRYVERPVRNGALVPVPRLVSIVSAGAAVVLVVTGASYISGGFPSRLRPASAAILAADTPLERLPCTGEQLVLDSGKTVCARGASGAAPSFVLVGDSHSVAIAEAFFHAAASVGKAGYHIGGPGFCPLPGVHAVRQPEHSAPMPDFMDLMQRQPAVKRVVVACYWQMRVSMARQFRKYEFRDADYDGSGRAYNRISLERGLQRLFEAFPDHTFVLLEGVPTGPALDPIAAVRLAHIWGLDTVAQRMGLSRADYDEQLRLYRPLLQRAAANYGRVKILPVADAMCDATRCHGWANGGPTYTDDNHVSDRGAMLMSEVFRRALGAAPQVSTLVHR